SPNALEIVSGSEDGTIRRWNPYTGRQIIPPIKNSHRWVITIKYSPQGDKFMSGGRDAICVWSKDGKLLTETWQGTRPWVFTVAVSPDGKYIASAGADK
ncbi:WD40 repeat-like protein, partial [Suillus decipiens]